MTRQFPDEDLYRDEPMPEVRKAPEKPVLYNDTLLSILEVSPADILTNDRNQITTGQELRLQGKLKEEGDASALLMNVGLGVLFLLAMIFWLEGLPIMPLVIGGGIYLGVFGFMIYRRQNAIRTDIQESDVQSVRGFPQLVDTGRLDREDKGRYWMLIGNQRFKITQRQYERLIQYDMPELTVYYSKKTKMLLSAEVVPYEAEKPKKIKNEELLLDDDVDELPPMEIIDDPMTEAEANQQRNRK